MVIPFFHSKRIAVPALNGKRFILKENIVYCEAEGNYTNFVMLNKAENFTSTCPLHDYEKQLPASESFLRVHNSYIANMNNALTIIRGNDAILIMIEKSRIPVSEKYKKDVMDTLDAEWKQDDENNNGDDWMDKEMD